MIKPATEASLSVLYLVEMLQEIGIPNGVLNVVTGHGMTAGDALARHRDVDRIAFTGSTETGRRIIDASKVNIKRLQLELGGKSPDIVFAEADLEKAVPGAAMGIFANSGQICYAVSRILVDRRIAKEFTARIADFVKGLRMGHSLYPEAQLGPLITEKQRDIVRAYVASGTTDGAKLVAGANGSRVSFERAIFSTDCLCQCRFGDDHRARGNLRPGCFHYPFRHGGRRSVNRQSN